MSSVLVCGASGFIGSHTCRALADAGFDVAGVALSPMQPGAGANGCFAGDLRELAFAREVIAQSNPEHIVFAAGPADVQASVEAPAQDFADQTLPLVNLLDAARRLVRLPSVLLVSSAAVYGNPGALPISESAPAAPVSPYGFHKLMQEMLLAEFRSLYGFPTCIARAFSTLGPGQRRLAVWDIARKAMSGVTELPGTGDETRDYLYIDDIAGAITRILSQARFEGEVINVASGNEVRIRALAQSIFDQLGLQAGPRFTGHALQGSPVRWRADVSRLQDLGFSPRTPLDVALKRTLAWIRDHA